MKLTAPQRRVLEFLDGLEGSASTQLVANAVGYSYPTLFAALVNLESAALVESRQVPADTWSITDAGRQAVAE